MSQVMKGFIKQLRLIFLFLSLIGCFKNGTSQSKLVFDSILNAKPILKLVKNDLKKYRLQIIYTQITRDKDGKPAFNDFMYNVDSSNYFYCASLVKLPCSILAFEKTKRLHLYSNTIMFTDSSSQCHHTVKKDPTSINGFPSVAQYVKRMAVVSDNAAYDRIFEFLGVDEIHTRLNEMGYKNMRIVHRFGGNCYGPEQTLTNPITFLKNDLTPITSLPQQEASSDYRHPLGDVKIGKAHLNSENRKVDGPKDFSKMNYMSLENTHSMLRRLIFNNEMPESMRFKMMEDDRLFLIEQLTIFPSESINPSYNKSYHDSYKKYFIYGDSRKNITNRDLKITNIVGQSYGFMIDCAYIHNEIEKVEFMLSAVIYTNEDEIINDGKYEYKTVGLPFLAELGRQMYAYELERKK
jgi:hypothetical protein